jgi:hypothetical protein
LIVQNLSARASRCARFELIVQNPRRFKRSTSERAHLMWWLGRNLSPGRVADPSADAATLPLR